MISKTLAKLTLAIFAISAIVACSQVPYPTTYGLSSQKLMQAAEHWQIQAEDTADSISEKVRPGSRLFIERENEEPFYIYFADFLEQELVGRNFVLCSSKSSDCLPIQVQARVLEHGKRFIDVYPGLVPAATGVVFSSLAVIGGTSTGDLSTNEVLVTVKIINNGQTLLAKNNIYYINEDEIWHYNSLLTSTGIKIPNKKIKVVGE
ncbi:hypothetical protein [Maridesulfovibrio hydrothermalis]|uniref:Lipoprotein n=1 Tax=Maridesulfovibrio hydrothermalis AM13 = DSM 14728 TaxID=1121451 RepID=L0RA43_9BACT|nr:hypothetical protein [Maridesulfovibrio hydrothermalis]CCO23658.1 exported protein of unknown function [Maridesulfovibrio hydrothermalis AM13 = DSM 14728]